MPGGVAAGQTSEAKFVLKPQALNCGRKRSKLG